MSNLPSTMSAVLCPNYGAADQIIVEKRKTPSPREHEILVKVYASAITTADSMMRSGEPRFARIFLGLNKPKNPYLGTGFAGEVVQVGSKVNRFKVSDMVFGESGLNFAANSEYVCVNGQGVVAHKPPEISFLEAACLCDGPLTSYNFIHQIGKAQKGQRILINGGAGSLGVAAIQLAKNLGCHVAASASPHNFEFLKSLGANEVLDYREESFLKQNEVYDMIYDTVGTMDFDQCKGMLKSDGLYMSPVLSFNLLMQMLKSKLFKKQRKAKFSATGMKDPKELLPMLQSVLALIEGQKLKVPIDQIFSLQEVSQAHAQIDSKHKKANYILKIK